MTERKHSVHPEFSHIMVIVAVNLINNFIKIKTTTDLKRPFLSLSINTVATVNNRFILFGAIRFPCSRWTII